MRPAVVLFGFWLYLLFGLRVFLTVDRKEMRKEVPYADLPSLLPLRTYRLTLAALCMLVGVPVTCWAIWRALKERL